MFRILSLCLLIAMMLLPPQASTFTVRSYVSKDRMVGSPHRKLVNNDDHDHNLWGSWKFLIVSKTIKRMTNSRSSRVKALAPLQMVVTKSGGRAIQSQLQFDIEVLHQVDFLQQVPSDSLGSTDPSNDKCNTNIKERTTQLFIPSTTPTLVFFSAPWCGPCRLSNPVVKEIIKQFVPRIDVVEVCTDDLPEIAEEAGVTSIPTIQIYHEGKLLDTIVGCVAENVLGNAVKKVLEDLGWDSATLGDSQDDFHDNSNDSGDNI